MNKHVFFWVGISGFLAVAVGAFGAHGLKPHLSETELDIYEKAGLYHFIHTAVLVAIAVLPAQYRQSFLPAFRAFGTGIILFSGSLYVLAVKNYLGWELPNWFGLLTPIGGIFFLVGWLAIIWGGREK